MNGNKFKELVLKVRKNKRTGSLDVNIPRKKLSLKELDNIQKKKQIRFLMESLE